MSALLDTSIIVYNKSASLYTVCRVASYSYSSYTLLMLLGKVLSR